MLARPRLALVSMVLLLPVASPSSTDDRRDFAGHTVLVADLAAAGRFNLPEDSGIQSLHIEGAEASDSIGLLLSGPRTFLFLREAAFQWPPWGSFNIDGTSGLLAGSYNAYVVAPRQVRVHIVFEALEGASEHQLTPWSGSAVHLGHLAEHLDLPQDVAVEGITYETLPKYHPVELQWTDLELDSPGAVITVEYTSTDLLNRGFQFFSRHSVVSTDSEQAMCQTGTTIPSGLAGGAVSWRPHGFLVPAGSWEVRMDGLGFGSWTTETYAFAVPLLPHDGFLDWDPAYATFDAALPDESWLPDVEGSGMVPWERVHATPASEAVRATANQAYCLPRPSL